VFARKWVAWDAIESLVGLAWNTSVSPEDLFGEANDSEASAFFLLAASGGWD